MILQSQRKVPRYLLPGLLVVGLRLRRVASLFILRTPLLLIPRFYYFFVLVSFFWVSRKRRTRSRVRDLPKTTMLSRRGGDMVLPVRIARRSMKFSLTDHCFSSPSFFKAGSRASWVQSGGSRMVSCSAA